MKRNAPASPSARIRAATTNSSLRRLILSIRAFEGSRNDLNNKPIRQNRRPKNFPMSRQCVTVRHSRNIICYVAALLRLGNRAMFRPAGSHQLRIGVIGNKKIVDDLLCDLRRLTLFRVDRKSVVMGNRGYVLVDMWG